MGATGFAWQRAMMVGFTLASTGCGGAMLLQAPIEEQCKTTGLMGCAELTQGTLAFVEGDRATGAKKLGQGAAVNSPKDLKQFAEAISALGSIPGVSQYMGPVLEVAAILKGEKAVAGVEVAAQEAETKQSGEVADARRTSGKVYPAKGDRKFTCAGNDASACVRSKSGPFLVTDVSVTRDCGDSAVIFSADPGTPELASARWIVSGGISNGKWFVPDGDVLVLAVVGRPGDSLEAQRGCAISWSSTGQP